MLCCAAAFTAGSVRAASPSDPTQRFTALTHVDWVVFRESSEDEIDPTTRAPLNEDRFLLRRLRAGYVIEQPVFVARAELEVSGERGFAGSAGSSSFALAPYEVSLGARHVFDFAGAPQEDPNGPRLEALARLGVFPIPFGHDAVEPVQERALLERTTVTRALFPGQRDLGVGLDVKFSVLRVALAWMNGEPLGERGYGGLDTTRMKDLVGRFGIEVRIGERWRIATGVSGLGGQGLHPGNPATKDRLSWVDGNENGLVEISELGVIPGGPRTASETFSRFAIGADALLDYEVPVLGRLRLSAEILRAKNLDRGLEPADPVARGRDLRELGWCFGVAQRFTRYAELALRYDVYDPDADARRQSAARVVPVDARYRTFAVAASARLDHYRLLLEYAHRDNALGISASGAPTTLADDSLTLRGEFSY